MGQLFVEVGQNPAGKEPMGKQSVMTRIVLEIGICAKGREIAAHANERESKP